MYLPGMYDGRFAAQGRQKTSGDRCNCVVKGVCASYPYCPEILRCAPRRFITCFVTVFATVIAITKDLADVEGDRKYGIQTFTTRLGTRRVTFLGARPTCAKPYILDPDHEVNPNPNPEWACAASPWDDCGTPWTPSRESWCSRAAASGSAKLLCTLGDTWVWHAPSAERPCGACRAPAVPQFSL